MKRERFLTAAVRLVGLLAADLAGAVVLGVAEAIREAREERRGRRQKPKRHP